MRQTRLAAALAAFLFLGEEVSLADEPAERIAASQIPLGEVSRKVFPRSAGDIGRADVTWLTAAQSPSGPVRLAAGGIDPYELYEAAAAAPKEQANGDGTVQGPVGLRPEWQVDLKDPAAVRLTLGEIELAFKTKKNLAAYEALLRKGRGILWANGDCAAAPIAEDVDNPAPPAAGLLYNKSHLGAPNFGTARLFTTADKKNSWLLLSNDLHSTVDEIDVGCFRILDEAHGRLAELLRRTGKAPRIGLESRPFDEAIRPGRFKTPFPCRANLPREVQGLYAPRSWVRQKKN